MASFPLILAQQAGHSNSALITFAIYTLAVFVIAALSNRLLQSKSFLSEYFLGSRGLGVWAFALTFAATSSSGGSFMGFPSLVYTHGWSLALWIGSYMLVPVVAMGLLGKRLNQVARKSGAITIPDVLHSRFESRKFGMLATLLIVFFMVFNLVAQFKAGAKILNTLLDDVPLFQEARNWTGQLIAGNALIGRIEPGYLLCLVSFALAVIVYTSYGGFRAVVWTDVLQGLVMVFGVLLMLPLAIWLVGGFGQATDQLAKMTPPRHRVAILESPQPVSERVIIPQGTWVEQPAGPEQARRVFRTANQTVAIVEPGTTQAFVELQNGVRESRIPVLEITTPEEIERIERDRFKTNLTVRVVDLRMRIAANSPVYQEVNIAAGTLLTRPATEIGPQRYFTTDVPTVINNRSTNAVARAEDGTTKADIPVTEISQSEAADIETLPPVPLDVRLAGDYVYGDGTRGMYVSGPGPSETDVSGFLPLSLAVSFFFMWTFSGAGQPSNMVRLMAFNSSQTLRRAIFTVAIYYSAIYFPLVAIFCMARVLLPGWEIDPDRIMPEMAKHLTTEAGWPWLAGLLVAAPFAAVMSTVDSFLLMISSAVVRDVYQREINPAASEKTIKRLTYSVTVIIGITALVGAMNPPDFLQHIIIYTGSGLSGSFLAPVALALYWPRLNATGAIAGMLGGFLTHLSLYGAGFFLHGSFQALRIANFDPLLPAMLMSFVCAVLFSLITAPPPRRLVEKYFYE